MSEKQVIQKLKHIVEMLLQQTLPDKEVLNSKVAAFYRRLSHHYVCKWARRGLFSTSRLNNGNRSYKRRNLYSWLLSSDRAVSSSTNEAEKMAILNPERG